MVISQTHYLHPYSLPHHNRPLASKQSLGKWWGPPTGLERDTEKPGELKALGYETSGEDSISAPKNLTTWLEKCSGLACGCLAVVLPSYTHTHTLTHSHTHTHTHTRELPWQAQGLSSYHLRSVKMLKT